MAITNLEEHGKAFGSNLYELMKKEYFQNYLLRDSFMAAFGPDRKPTVNKIEVDVWKLRSVSEAGRKWIVDERCKRLSIGRHKGTIYFHRKKETP